MNAIHRFLPLAIVLLALVFLASQGLPGKSDGAYDLARFGSVPVSADGRVKPLDTVARTSLMIVSGKQTFTREGERQPAIRWLADVMGRTQEAQQYKVFRIDHPDVQTLIQQSDASGHYFALTEIMPHMQAVVAQGQRAFEVPANQRNPFQRGVLQLYRQVTTFTELSSMQTPYMVPPLADGDEWAPFAAALAAPHTGGEAHPAIDAITAIMSAYHHEQPTAFNTAVADYRAAFVDHMPDTARKASFEVFFNRFAPFYQTTILYVVALLLTGAALLMRSVSSSPWAHTLGRTAFWLLVLAFLLHTFGLGARIYLQGRPPVTNLYSSAIFVGWGAVLLALLMERIYQLGLGNLVAAVIGFVTLIIAHNLAGDGDTMQMMQAVLDSNFWLATHVIVITLGYSVTFLAGLLAIIYILLGVFTRALVPDVAQALTKMVYGTICVALLFSFVGTVLGGIWADQSWGRFWGWDPKENGAAMIVLMHALILHARWGGMIRVRGMMVLAVTGNIVCVWAWFGTNMLGVGLHSYGFMDRALFWLLAFVVSQLFVMSLGMMRPEVWRSGHTKRAAALRASAEQPAAAR